MRRQLEELDLELSNLDSRYGLGDKDVIVMLAVMREMLVHLDRALPIDKEDDD